MNKLAGTTLIVGAVLLAANTKNDSTAEPTGHAGPSSVADIPAAYLTQYKAAGNTCGHLDWALLAGIGKVETNHGRSNLPGVHSGSNSAGAAGPMQFIRSTFASVRARHSDVGSDIYAPGDAIPAAAHYLCDSGLSGGNEYRAIYHYNHAGWYVDKVRAQAKRYRTAA